MGYIGYEVLHVEQLGGYRLRLRFADGSIGDVDIAEILGRFTGVFAPLADPSFFARVEADPDAATLVWPGGEIDIAPETLYEAATGRSADQAGARA
ncbi:MAG TPA: DUF2442 domain-containing protein [Actinomycetota bacterium]